jgi:hypothetical protein
MTSLHEVILVLPSEAEFTVSDGARALAIHALTQAARGNAVWTAKPALDADEWLASCHNRLYGVATALASIPYGPLAEEGRVCERLALLAAEARRFLDFAYDRSVRRTRQPQT